MLGDSVNKAVLILVTKAAFPVGNGSRQCKNPVEICGRAQHENIFVLLQIRFYTFLQVPLRNDITVWTGYRRSLGNYNIDLVDSPVQNLVHRSAAHTVQSEIAGVKYALAVRFDEEQIAVRSGVVNAKGCDLNITDQKRFPRRESLDAFHALAECIIFWTAVPSRY